MERLAHCSGFAELSRGCLKAIAEQATACSFRPGSHMLTEGMPGDHVYFLLSGRAKMIRHVEEGRRLVLALFHPGDTFGTTATMGKRSCDASVVAIQDALCLRLSRAALFALIRTRPEWLDELMPVLTRPLSECRNCTVELSCLKVEKRFAKLLLKLADSVGKELPEGTFIPVRLSRQELADMTGTTIETCIRTMSRWGKDSWVQTQSDGFVILNRPALEGLSGSPTARRRVEDPRLSNSPAI